MEKFYCVCGYIAVALICILILYYIFNTIVVLIIDKKRQRLKILRDIKELQFEVNKSRYEFVGLRDNLSRSLYKQNELLVDLIKVISKQQKNNKN